MWTMLAGVPGKLKTMADRLTAGRAANLDNLNATVSSRAAASTALSNATWTNDRAAKLDTLLSLTPTAAIQKSTFSRNSTGSVTHLNISGSGVINFFGVFSTLNSTASTSKGITGTATLTIDGVAIVMTASNSSSFGSSSVLNAAMIGVRLAGTNDIISGLVTFNQSLVLTSNITGVNSSGSTSTTLHYYLT